MCCVCKYDKNYLNLESDIFSQTFDRWIPLVKLGCGGTTTANNSYIVQSGVTSLSSPCTYTVCPCSTDVCRIRYDFTVSVHRFSWIIDPDENVFRPIPRLLKMNSPLLMGLLLVPTPCKIISRWAPALLINFLSVPPAKLVRPSFAVPIPDNTVSHSS